MTTAAASSTGSVSSTAAAAATTATSAVRTCGLRRHFLIALGVALLALLVFAQSVRFDFVYFDDHDYVVRNERVLGGLTLDNVRWAFTTLKLVNWHPLTWLSHMLDVTLYGTWAGGHHLTSAILHAANAALLYLVLVYLTGRAGRSVLVATLFAVHPLRMESVAWVSERKDLLSGFFFILMLGAYSRYARSRGPAWYVATLVALALGLMSKSMLVTAPCVLLLLDFWPLDRVGRERVARLLGEKIPMVAMCAAISVVTYMAQRGGGAVGEDRVFPLARRLGNAVWAYGRYLRKTLWPNDLAVFYPYEGLNTPFPWGRAIAAGVVLLMLTLLAVRLWRRERAVLVGWLWFLGMLVPTIGVVQVGGQALADRYTYLPHVGLLIAIVWALALLTDARPSLARLMKPAAVAAVVALTLTTLWQLPSWRNTETLFTRAAQVTDRNARAHVCLALFYGDLGEHERARQHYELALKYHPTNAEANNNYGNLLAEEGHADEAIRHIQLAVRAEPRYAEAHNNLANLLAKRGEVQLALHHHAQAVRLDPDLAAARFNYGVTLASVGRLREAQIQLERALQLRPDYADARYTYGLVMAGLGYEVAATGQLRDANFLRRDWFEALRSLAWLLATSPDPLVRNGAQAVVVAERANQVTGYENPVALDTLAAAYAEAGRFDNAVATAARAEQLARAAGQSELADRFASRLARYREKKPFHRVAGATTQPFNP